MAQQHLVGQRLQRRHPLRTGLQPVADNVRILASLGERVPLMKQFVGPQRTVLHFRTKHSAGDDVGRGF